MTPVTIGLVSLDWTEVPAGVKELMPIPFRYVATTPCGSYKVVPQGDRYGKFDSYTAVFWNNGRLCRGPGVKYLGDAILLDDAKAICEQHAARLAKGEHDVGKSEIRSQRQFVERRAQARMEVLRQRPGRTGGVPACVVSTELGCGKPSRPSHRGGVNGRGGDHGVRDAPSPLGFAGLDDRTLRGWIACYWPARQTLWKRMKIREALYVLRTRLSN